MQTTKTLPKDALKVLDDELLPPDKLGVYASADLLYKNTVFGRDSLEVAEDLLYLRPDVVEGVLLKLASLQGSKHNSLTEEEPGKIHHEHRTLNGSEQGARVIELFHDLSEKWGGNGNELTYYGSVDSTPLFVRLALNYAAQYGTDLEVLKIKRKDGGTVNVKEAVAAGLEWITRVCENSGTGLLEYQASNPRGLINQAWKDSNEFYIHSNGEYVNHDAPIASIEVQGYAYDALKLGELAFPESEGRYKKLRLRIQKQTLGLLWMDEEKYFCLGLDYEERSKKPRRIEVITANPGSLLDSAIFDDLPLQKQKLYIGGIVNHIFSDDFLTFAGIRSRALRHAELVKIWDYHGSFVTWPKETYDIARGLERYGFHQLSRQLKNRLISLVNSAGGYLEFVYVNRDGNVLYNSDLSSGDAVTVKGTNHPESPQAWTVSALAAILADDCPLMNVKIPTWKSLLEARILASIPSVGDESVEPALLLTPFQLKRDN